VAATHATGWKRHTPHLVVWLLLPAFRILGCGGGGSSVGSPCRVDPNGCDKAADWCDNGLDCDYFTRTCQHPVPAQPPTPDCSDPFDTDSCAPSESTRVCSSVSVAVSWGCRPSADGSAVSCCPACGIVEGGCGDPAVGYDCTDPHTPTQGAASLRCAFNFSYSIPQGESQYCCTSSDACFRTGEYPSICGDAGLSYAYTGTATPSSAGLRCGPAPDAGALGRYCCDEGDGGDGGLAEASADWGAE
jgi:hypothetical protein